MQTMKFEEPTGMTLLLERQDALEYSMSFLANKDLFNVVLASEHLYNTVQPLIVPENQGQESGICYLKRIFIFINDYTLFPAGAKFFEKIVNNFMKRTNGDTNKIAKYIELYEPNFTDEEYAVIVNGTKFLGLMGNYFRLSVTSNMWFGKLAMPDDWIPFVRNYTPPQKPELHNGEEDEEEASRLDGFGVDYFVRFIRQLVRQPEFHIEHLPDTVAIDFSNGNDCHSYCETETEIETEIETEDFEEAETRREREMRPIRNLVELCYEKRLINKIDRRRLVGTISNNIEENRINEF